MDDSSLFSNLLVCFLGPLEVAAARRRVPARVPGPDLHDLPDGLLLQPLRHGLADHGNNKHGLLADSAV